MAQPTLLLVEQADVEERCSSRTADQEGVAASERSGRMANDFSLCWDIDSLNKAYRQGYMAGVMGMERTRCPYIGEVVEAAWEAGWEDGAVVCALDRPGGQIAS